MKTKFPANLASAAGAEACFALTAACSRIEVAGSLRRGRKEVGDVEILYVPNNERPVFGQPADPVDRVLQQLETRGILEKRKNSLGRETFGAKIKLMRHTKTGIPIDLFATTEASWWNYLVCRTGGAESNKRIAMRAQERNFKWEPYSAGFRDLKTNELIPMNSEEAVFKFVGIPYEQPYQRP